MIYRPNSEHARRVEEFLRDLQHEHDLDRGSLEILDVDSRDGIAMASMYDVMSAPAIIVTDNIGSYIKSWIGEELPLMGEIAAYTYAG